MSKEGQKTRNDHINLKVAGQDCSVVLFRIKRRTPLSKLRKAYEDEDAMDVFQQQQTGGAASRGTTLHPAFVVYRSQVQSPNNPPLSRPQEVKQGQETQSPGKEEVVYPSIATCSWTPKRKKAPSGFGSPQHPQWEGPKQDAPGQQQLPGSPEKSILMRAGMETPHQERPKEKPCQAGPQQVHPRPWSPSPTLGNARVPGQER
ncbi:Small ubiquitin-related modifier 3 [Heterocephalus glaber]|uniref:Small ubiquitin-related modifier 3 n=1 Tax=Heterocephalus glaber TaxID=10181 RepID=G5BQG1_HETGA|nr:Small ubiquitin-related modifier 3 [Heterocephalus glaber]